MADKPEQQKVPDPEEAGDDGPGPEDLEQAGPAKEPEPEADRKPKPKDTTMKW